MPIAGGPADKTGNAYEVLVACGQLLRVIRDQADGLLYEPVEPTVSQGIEFVLDLPLGLREFWSVKRQRSAAAGWTLASLTAEGAGGRSILGDLWDHLRVDEKHQAVFASTLGAPALDELIDFVKRKTFLPRLDQNERLKQDYERHILPLAGDAATTIDLLARTRVEVVSESTLTRHVEDAIAWSLGPAHNRSFDASEVRRLLGEWLIKQMHVRVDREAVISFLNAGSIRLRPFSIDPSMRTRLRGLCDAYTGPILARLIRNTSLCIRGTTELTGADGVPGARCTLIVGDAGGGKSCTLAQTVSRLREADIPTLPIRFDTVPSATATTRELGQHLNLPESPVRVLDGVAGEQRSVLVLDQLDAVSLVSGRRADLWELFQKVVREAVQVPTMCVIVGCRAFDLAHDHRLRELKEEGSDFQIVKLEPLTDEQVKEVVGDDTPLAGTLMPVLTNPLHLSMFLDLSRDERSSLHGEGDLFDHFWEQKEQGVRQRMDQTCDWARVLRRLTERMSARQDPGLSVPESVLDEERATAQAMASEHVLILENKRWRFFHESFFDYAYARRFAASDDKLLDLLRGGEQHLFRRSQVRQVLAYLRSADEVRYLRELEEVLFPDGVRFHLKRAVLDWLGSLTDPTATEWALLERWTATYPDLRFHVRRVIFTGPAWFDTVDQAGFIDSALASGDEEREREAIWLCARPDMLKQRSARIAAILTARRQNNDRWRSYLRSICSWGDVCHSPEIFTLFLSLIDDGTLDQDDADKGRGDRSMMWHGITKDRLDLACEAIRCQLDRQAAALQEACQAGKVLDLWRGDWMGLDERTLHDAAEGCPEKFVELLLPWLADRVNEMVEPDPEPTDRLTRDPAWHFRSYQERTLFPSSALLQGLATAMEHVAKHESDLLDRVLDPLHNRPHETLAYLTLRAWTAAPERYADRLAVYLAEDPRRLKVGYVSWSGGGDAGIKTSVDAVAAASRHASLDCVAVLERAIVQLTDRIEAKTPRWRGWKQLELLMGFEPSRLGERGQAKLSELRRKFPHYTAEPPKAGGRACKVGSPIPPDAISQMTNSQWLAAMRKYNSDRHHANTEDWLKGGKQELSAALEERVEQEPVRFIAMALSMPDDTAHAYYNAVLRGLAEVEPGLIDQSLVVRLIGRIHGLEGHPCGRSICWLIKKQPSVCCHAEVVDIAAWYATQDPDPKNESWQETAPGGSYYHLGDPYNAGINSVRGSAAGAIEVLLVEKPSYFNQLRDAVEHLAGDPSVAVRSCALAPVAQVLNIDRRLGIEWFLRCVDTDDAVLATPHVERVVYFVGHSDYVAVRPVLRRMLSAADPKTVAVGSRVSVLLSLATDDAEPEAGRVRDGTDTMRQAAARVYAANVAHPEVGARCLEQVIPLLGDPQREVAQVAANAFEHFGDLPEDQQATLVEAFLRVELHTEMLRPVLRAMEQSSSRLPDTATVRLTAAAINVCQDHAGNLATRDAMIAGDVAQLVLRTYTQSLNKEVLARCLDQIDTMEQHNFYGLSDELRRAERRSI